MKLVLIIIYIFNIPKAKYKLYYSFAYQGPSTRVYCLEAQRNYDYFQELSQCPSFISKNSTLFFCVIVWEEKATIAKQQNFWTNINKSSLNSMRASFLISEMIRWKSSVKSCTTKNKLVSLATDGVLSICSVNMDEFG